MSYNDEKFEDDFCDLDETKICDNCEKCLGIDHGDYMEIKIDGILKDDLSDLNEYEDFEVFESEEEKNEEFEYEFIEDIEEIRERENKKIEDILKGED